MHSRLKNNFRSWATLPRILVCGVVAVLVFAGLTALAATKPSKPPAPKPGDLEPGSEIKLQRVPPMTPQQSHDATDVLTGFRMDLVASEPNVASPVAMAFDEAGRLYVVEMIDYSEKDKA